MKITCIVPILLAMQAFAIPTHYQAPLNTTTITEADNLDPIPPSACLAKLEGVLQGLTSSTLSVLFGSTTTMLGYAFCGFTMPADTFETCTDYAVIGGSVVGLSHLAMWKFPEVLDDLNLYQSNVRPWQDPWAGNASVYGQLEVKPREHVD